MEQSGSVAVCRGYLARRYLRQKCLREESNDVQTRIQELRKAGKVTQNELADAVNVTRQTIISLENGKYNASLILAHKIAQFFGVSIEEIFIFDKEDENL